MLPAKVTIGVQGELTPIFMSDPFGNSRNINTGFNTGGRKKMAKVMMSNPRNTNLFTGMVDSALCLAHFKNLCGERLVRPFGSNFSEERPCIGDHWHTPHLPVFC